MSLKIAVYQKNLLKLLRNLILAFLNLKSLPGEVENWRGIPREVDREREKFTKGGVYM